MICNNCGKEIDNDAAFCSKCGNKMETEPIISICTNCENILDEGAMFCSQCGTNVENIGEEEKTTSWEEHDSQNKDYIEKNDETQLKSNLREENKRREGSNSFGRETIIITGKKRVTRFAKKIITTITIKDDNINVHTVLSLFKKKSKDFHISEISSVETKTVTIMGAIDIIRIVLMASLAMVSIKMGEIILGVGFALAALLFLWMTLTRAMIISLNGKTEIIIPICNDKDVIEFYDNIGYGKNNLNDKESKSNTIFWVWFIITIVIIGMGFERYGATEQEAYEISADHTQIEENQEQAEIEDINTGENPVVETTTEDNITSERIELVTLLNDLDGSAELQLEKGTDENGYSIETGEGIHILYDSSNYETYINIDTDKYSLYGLYVGLIKEDMDKNISENYPNLQSIEMDGEESYEGKYYCFFEDNNLNVDSGIESVVLACSIADGKIDKMTYQQYMPPNSNNQDYSDSSATRENMYDLLKQQISYTSENGGDIRDIASELYDTTSTTVYIYNFSDYYITYVEFLVIQYDNRGQYLTTSLYNYNNTIRNDFDFTQYEYLNPVDGHEVGGIEGVDINMHGDTRKYRTCVKQVWFDNGETWINPYYETFLALFETGY